MGVFGLPFSIATETLYAPAPSAVVEYPAVGAGAVFVTLI